VSDTEQLFERLIHAIDEACLKAYIDGARGATLEAGHTDRLDATRAFWDAKDEVRSALEAWRQAGTQ
jgi:hypothetical protein